jgi:hypothetical protein
VSVRSRDINLIRVSSGASEKEATGNGKLRKRGLVMSIRRESDLYGPVKQFLTNRGFRVRGEVKECDVVAIRDDVTVVVELKPVFNLALVFQGIDRQTITPYVYLGVEAPSSPYRCSQWRDIQRLCARLGLGLLAVHFSEIDGDALDVEVVREPGASSPRLNKRRRKLLSEEFWQRTGDYNEGGSPGSQPVVTAYRELALHVASFLHTHGHLLDRHTDVIEGC